MAFTSAVLDLFSKTYTCLSGDAVGNFVYLSGNDTVTTADGGDAAEMPAIGCIVNKPTTTSCIVQYAGEAGGYTGLVAGTTYYVSTAGLPIASAAGLVVAQVIGVAKDTTTLVLENANLVGGQSISGNLAVSGNLTVAGNSGFYGTGAQAQPANTADARHALVTLGLIASGGDGLASPIRIPLIYVRNDDYTVADATGGSGKVKIAGTLGSALNLQSEQASVSTVTDKFLFEFVLPPTYIAAQNLTITYNVQRTVTGATGLVSTVQAKVYRMVDAGTTVGDIGPGSATTFTSATAVDVAITITGTTLVPGDRLLVETTLVATAGAATTNIDQVNSIRIS